MRHYGTGESFDDLEGSQHDIYKLFLLVVLFTFAWLISVVLLRRHPSQSCCWAKCWPASATRPPRCSTARKIVREVGGAGSTSRTFLLDNRVDYTRMRMHPRSYECYQRSVGAGLGPGVRDDSFGALRSCCCFLLKTAAILLHLEAPLSWCSFYKVQRISDIMTISLWHFC